MTVIERPLFGRVELQRAEIRQLLRAGFESVADTPWTLPATMVRENAGSLSYYGNWRLRINADTATRTARSELLPVTPGMRYTIALYVRRDAAFNGSATATKLRIASSSDSFLGELTFALSDMPAAGVWYRRAIEWTAPAGYTAVRFNLLANNTAGFAALDSITVTPLLPSWYPAGMADALQLTIRRGGSRQSVGVKTDVGLMTFQLLDAGDPMAGGTFAPGQEIRGISRDLAGGLSELFTGRVVDVASSYPLNKSTGRQRAVTTVTVADAVKTHGETPRYGVAIPTGFETFEARISRLAGSALAPIEAPAQGAPREVYAF
ncbi:minor tail protein [Microbacterium phage Kaijohn]|uniref:Minor tail protein n=1 Tax=Microbacterium phage Kaijohn TaxID=2653750 RepID=A0A5Q2WLH6_9CAUD|nr:minor tail protein [Microbacterium phage Kaijohn]QGH78533.1 minor tail protein [Microbacterium phage Kaijohn]